MSAAAEHATGTWPRVEFEGRVARIRISDAARVTPRAAERIADELEQQAAAGRDPQVAFTGADNPRGDAYAITVGRENAPAAVDALRRAVALVSELGVASGRREADELIVGLPRPAATVERIAAPDVLSRTLALVNAPLWDRVYGDADPFTRREILLAIAEAYGVEVNPNAPAAIERLLEAVRAHHRIVLPVMTAEGCSA